MVHYLGLFLLLAMTLNMWALLSVIGSATKLSAKGLWALGLAACPGFGYLLWLFFGPRAEA